MGSDGAFDVKFWYGKGQWCSLGWAGYSWAGLVGSMIPPR